MMNAAMFKSRTAQWQIITATCEPLFVAKKPKIAKHLLNPQPIKRPKWRDPEIDGLPLAWRFSGCDRGGPFSWAELTDKFKEAIERLHEFETKSWDEIIRSGSHPIAVSDIEKPARDRLVQIKQDDIDELMSFRIDGKKRIWCIKDGNIMRVLWWDPEHAVCPAPKRHT
jgi:hypothetical protein